MFGLPEGVVLPKDILEGTVLWLAGSSRRLLLYHVAGGLVGPVCACAYCAACAALHSVHGVSGSQFARLVRPRGALGGAWIPSGRRGAYNLGLVAASTSRACALS